MKKNKKNSLSKRRVGKIFDNQISKLASLDVPAYIIVDHLFLLEEFREKIIRKVLELDAKGFSFDVWFIPVISDYRILNRISLKEKNNFPFFDYIEEDKSLYPYYLFGVNKNSLSSEVFINPRKFLTSLESFYLCFYENIMYKYSERDNNILVGIKPYCLERVFWEENEKS